jgi:hypothetical protein
MLLQAGYFSRTLAPDASTGEVAKAQSFILI